MDEAEFDSVLDSIAFGDAYYSLADQLASRNIDKDKLVFRAIRDFAEKLGFSFDKRDQSLSRKSTIKTIECTAWLRQLKGGSVELGINVKCPGTRWLGSNFPDLAFQHKTRTSPEFSRQPPYPRLNCASLEDLQQALGFLSEVEEALNARLSRA